MRTNLTLFDDPLTFVRRFTTDMERFFENAGFSKPLAASFKSQPAEWLPSIDVVEKNGTLAVRADLPGLTPKDITIEATDEMLTIKGERKIDIEEKKDGVYRKERTYGSFFRSIPLPEGVTADSIKATFANGVLEVTMPMPKDAKDLKPRKIEVLPAADVNVKTAA